MESIKNRKLSKAPNVGSGSRDEIIMSDSKSKKPPRSVTIDEQEIAAAVDGK